MQQMHHNSAASDTWHVHGVLTFARWVQDSCSAPALVYQKVQAVYIQLALFGARQQETAVESIPAPKQ
jgi:hypothetical protein